MSDKVTSEQIKAGMSFDRGDWRDYEQLTTISKEQMERGMSPDRGDWRKGEK